MRADAHPRRQGQAGVEVLPLKWLIHFAKWVKEAFADTDPNIETALLRPYTRHDPSQLALGAVVVAKQCLGQGEDGGNNVGPWLSHIREVAGKPGKPLPGGAWCAAFVSYCLVISAEKLGESLPFDVSAGARRLYKNIGKAGSFPNIPQMGDVACWRRGQGWQGHVGIVIGVGRGCFTTIEGNRGKHPSKVRVFNHELSEPGFVGFARCP